MTSSFQSTAFQSAARPVDTFVAQPSVLPKTDMEELATTLAAINPNIQKFIQNKLDTVKQEETDKGIEIALNEAKSTLKPAVSIVRKKEGDAAARQLIGGSIFSQAGYEKTKAKLAGDSASRKINSLYDTYTVTQTKSDGTQFQIPISQFDVGTPEYKMFLEEASNYNTDSLQGIRSNYLTEHFYPKQASALEKVTSKHIKQHNEFNFQRTKKQALPTVFSGLETYIDGDKETALSNINEYIEDNVILGLAGDKQTKFFDSMLDVGKSAISRMYGVTGSTANIDLGIEMLGEINYGPGGSSKLRNHPKFETTFLKLKDDLNEQKDKDTKRQLEKIKAVEDNTIERIIQKYPEDSEAAEALLDAFPFRKKKVLETVEIFETNRTTKYQELALDVGSGLYANRPDEALDELKEIWDGHGGTATPEDKSNYDKTFTVIQNYKKAATVNYDTRRNRAIRQAAKLTGAKFDANGFSYYPEELAERGKQALELENEFTRDVIDQIQNATGLDIEQKEQLFRNLQDNYLREAEILATGRKVFEQQEEIEALAEDSGLTEDQIKEILSDQGLETVISSQGEEENVNVEQEVKKETNEPGGSGTGFFETLFRKENKTDNAQPGVASEVTQADLDRERTLDIQDLLDETLNDYGGLAELVRSGESQGSGLYNAYNGGTTDSAGEMDITSKTIGEMEQMQANNEVFAVGAYQFTPGVLTEARIYSGIEKDAIMTPAVQDRLFWGMLLSGRKRPALAAYLSGQSEDLRAAHEDLALEFAAIQGPDNVGMYDNDVAGNYATIDAMLVRETLVNARNLLLNRLQ